MSDANARKLGGLQSAAQVALEYLEGTDVWDREVVIHCLKRALANDGSEDYYSQRAEFAPDPEQVTR